MTTPGTDAVTLLTADHRQVEGLFAQIDSGTRYDAAVVDEIVRQLSVHDAVEKELLYPTVRQRIEGGEAMADRSLTEHQKVEEFLDRVEKAGDPEATLAALRETMANVAEHVAEEEGQVFPALRAALTPDELVQLGTRLDQAKVAAPTHPHPGSPNRGAGAVLGGTVAGLVDKAKDAVTGRPADQ